MERATQVLFRTQISIVAFFMKVIQSLVDYYYTFNCGLLELARLFLQF